MSDDLTIIELRERIDANAAEAERRFDRIETKQDAANEQLRIANARFDVVQQELLEEAASA